MRGTASVVSTSTSTFISTLYALRHAVHDALSLHALRPYIDRLTTATGCIVCPEALQRGPVNLLSLLPQEFTRQQAQEVRVAQGMKPNPKEMLRNWERRGYVVRDGERGVYAKSGQWSVVS